MYSVCWPMRICCSGWGGTSASSPSQPDSESRAGCSGTCPSVRMLRWRRPACASSGCSACAWSGASVPAASSTVTSWLDALTSAATSALSEYSWTSAVPASSGQ
jgi:Tfp pilus assembly protein PilV